MGWAIMICNLFYLDFTVIARRPEPQIGESAYLVSPTGNFGTFR